MTETGEIEFGLSQREIRVSEGSSYGELTVFLLFNETHEE